MKFTCLQENLTNALAKVYRAVPTKSELPILANILISAKDNMLTLSATNLSTTIVTNMGASIDKEGSITIPAKLLRDFVSNLSSNTIEAVLKDEILHLSSDKTKSKFVGITSEDYPDLPQENTKLPGIQIDPRLFSTAIASVAFCASSDDSRPVFTGIYLNYDGELITLAASDGFRLSETKIAPVTQGEPFSAVIPAKTLVDVSKVFSDHTTPIIFSLDTNNNLAMFKQDDTVIATRIIDGDYPDYKKIIPADSASTVEFSTGDLLEAVKLTDVFAKESDSAVVVKVNPNGQLEISVSAQEAGEHNSEVQANINSTQELQIGFNSKFLLDLLNNIKHEKLVFGTNGNTAPCVFKTLDDDNYQHIIMPMQIKPQ